MPAERNRQTLKPLAAAAAATVAAASACGDMPLGASISMHRDITPRPYSWVNGI